jgi:hypothetical protein
MVELSVSGDHEPTKIILSELLCRTNRTNVHGATFKQMLKL